MTTENVRDGHTIIVVGGGIAGLYAARELASRGATVTVLEMRDVFGGRIETGDLLGFVDDSSADTRPTFKAEFGPMRFELPTQPLFDRLCKDLGVGFGAFPRPRAAAPPSNHDLAGEEAGLDSLELLRLGIFRMFGKSILRTADGEIVLTAGDAHWLEDLTDDIPEGFERLRQTARIKGTGALLYTIGFWNALRQVLSTEAVNKIKDQGTFYHLIPENPNAVEWAIFWLRIFKLQKGETLSAIPQGVATVTGKLLEELHTKWPDVKLLARHQVIGLSAATESASKIRVEFVDRSAGDDRAGTLLAEHVVLALPHLPLTQLATRFPRVIQKDLDSVIPFVLLKVFLTMRRPNWWQPDKPDPQEFAWTLPTRELHYFLDDAGRNGMVLLYTDQPASAYWRDYVVDRLGHDRAQIHGNDALRDELVRWLLDRQRHLANARVVKPTAPQEPLRDGNDPVIATLAGLSKDLIGGGLRDLKSSGIEPGEDGERVEQLTVDPAAAATDLLESVADYAIRDWSAAPFGAGCHAWRPTARSWEIRPRLRAFALTDGDAANVHVCGEAYSDYQGFIEGALRSAADVVAAINGDTIPHSS